MSNYRFLLRPKWLAFHVLVLVAIVVMINLGFWQLRRLDQRREFNAEVRRNAAAAVVPLDDVLPAGSEIDADAAHDLEWRQVEASGTYDTDGELHVDQRSQGGIAGQVVLTPLVLDDGRVLLVERGFVPLGLSDEELDATVPPTGIVDVAGRLRTSEQRRTGGITDADPNDDIIPRVDIPAIADQLSGEPVPMFLELTVSDPAQSGAYPQPVDEPELGEGPHLGYAVQWFIFSVCVAVGWVLAVRHSARTRRRQAAPTSAAPASTADVDDAETVDADRPGS